jgi:hypothetical protein
LFNKHTEKVDEVWLSFLSNLRNLKSTKYLKSESFWRKVGFSEQNPLWDDILTVDDSRYWGGLLRLKMKWRIFGGVWVTFLNCAIFCVVAKFWFEHIFLNIFFRQVNILCCSQTSIQIFFLTYFFSPGQHFVL